MKIKYTNTYEINLEEILKNKKLLVPKKNIKKFIKEHSDFVLDMLLYEQGNWEFNFISNTAWQKVLLEEKLICA